MFLIGSCELNLRRKIIGSFVTGNTHTIARSALHPYVIYLINIRGLKVVIVNVSFWKGWMISTWGCWMSLNIFISVWKLMLMIVVLLSDLIKRTWSLLVTSLKWFLLLMINSISNVLTLVHLRRILMVDLMWLMVMISLIYLIWWLEYVTVFVDLMLIVWVLVEYWSHWIYV
jgi:hypothetical protein